jgi:hypothetical protein
MPQGFMAYIQPIGGGYPDQGLPGSEYPDQGLPGGGWGGGHPGHRPPGSRPPHVGNQPPRPPHTWPRPPGGGLPVDPDWGIPEGGHLHPDHGLPIHPIDPESPEQLPEVPGVEPLPPDPPPGTVWPPLPPDVPGGKALALVAIEGVGYRYVVIEIDGARPDNELPSPPPSRPPVAGQPLPRPPGRPGQPLPPAPQPKR